VRHGIQVVTVCNLVDDTNIADERVAFMFGVDSEVMSSYAE
jgi:hypothetical protein